MIQQLLAEAGSIQPAPSLVSVTAAGAEAAPDLADVKSPETYIGVMRAENFVSPGGTVGDKPHDYTASVSHLNQWGHTGNWTMGGEHTVLNDKDGGIVYRFHARDLHLVLGPAPEGGPVHFRVTIGGAAPGDSDGADVDAGGQGTVTDQRLYQLVRQNGPVADRTFETHFLDPGVQAWAFTFG